MSTNSHKQAYLIFSYAWETYLNQLYYKYYTYVHTLNALRTHTHTLKFKICKTVHIYVQLYKNVDIVNFTAHARIKPYTHTMNQSTDIWYRRQCYLYCTSAGNCMDFYPFFFHSIWHFQRF
jgi:hypothetical protein